MAYLYTTFLIFLLSIATGFSDGFTQSELAWPLGRISTNIPTPPTCLVTVSNSISTISKNQIATLFAHGSGGKFGQASPGPLHGSWSTLNTNTGAFTYTPAINYVGTDVVGFAISASNCFDFGLVYINVVDTNTTTSVCSIVTNVSIVDTLQVTCITNTLNGVVISSSCTTNSSALSSNVSGTFCSTPFVDTTCNGLGDTPSTATYITNQNIPYLTPHQTIGNITGFLQAGSGYQFQYPNETNTVRSLILSIAICNPSATNRTYQIVSTINYTNVYQVSLQDFFGIQQTSLLPPDGAVNYTNTFIVSSLAKGTNGYSYTVRGYDFSPFSPLVGTSASVSATVNLQ